jgi:hypothetical protein
VHAQQSANGQFPRCFGLLQAACVIPRPGLKQSERSSVWCWPFNTANAVIARRILAHAGLDDRVTVLVGTLGDGGETICTLRRDYGFIPGTLGG